MLNTAEQDIAPPPGLADASLGRRKQLVGVLWGVIDQDMPLEVGPAVLDRVQLRGVGGKVLQRQPAVRALDVLAYFDRAVGVQAVPHDDDGPLEIAHELPQEFAAFRGVDIFLGIEPEESSRVGAAAATGPRTDRPDHGNLRVGAAHLSENRRLACRCPRAPGHR